MTLRKQPPRRILKVTPRPRRRGDPEENFYVQHELRIGGYVIESCNVEPSLLPPWLPTIDIGDFDGSTPVRVQTRLDHRHGKRKGRVLYLFWGDQLVGVLTYHINRHREVEIKHVDARAPSEKLRLIRMRILIIRLKELTGLREGELRNKLLVWGPPDSDQRQLARILGFDEVHRSGQGRDRPAVFREGDVS
jgi:hypothetical protein